MRLPHLGMIFCGIVMFIIGLTLAAPDHMRVFYSTVAAPSKLVCACCGGRVSDDADFCHGCHHYVCPPCCEKFGHTEYLPPPHFVKGRP